MNRSGDLSVCFNNAGVRILLSNQTSFHYSVALDLFRGALEAKLLQEMHHFGGECRRRLSVCGDAAAAQSGEEHRSRLYSEINGSDVIHRALFYLHNLDSYLTPTTETMIQPQTCEYDLQVPILDQDAIPVPVQNRGFEPFLCMCPLSLPEDPTIITAQITSSVIVYNLGLVHQLLSRQSRKIADFYKISAAVLTNEVHTPFTVLLRVSLLNNFGVSCYDNGSGESMRICMEHLSGLLDDEDFYAATLIHAPVLEKLRSNILWLLTPPNGACPAA